MKNIDKPLSVNSIHGANNVTTKCVMKLVDTNPQFCILSTIGTFDGIIGFDCLRQIKTNIHRDQSSIPAEICGSFLSMIQSQSKVFSEPNKYLPFNTNVVCMFI